MNTNFLNSLTNFLKKRTYEVFGIILISIGIALTISFATYSPSDPSILYNETRASPLKLWYNYYIQGNTTKEVKDDQQNQKR